MSSMSTSRWFHRWVHFLLCLLLLAVGFPSGCRQQFKPGDTSGKTPIVRVLLFQSQTSISVTASESPTIKRLGDVSSRRVNISPGQAVPITLTSNGFQIGSAQVGVGEMQLLPAAEGSVAINGHAYRGRYRLIPRSSSTFDVVNDVDIEGYLKGLLARELFANFEEEAYRAQAVVARTYALYIKQTHSPSSDYDLFSDERDQVYGGISAESAKANAAVEDTNGLVAVFGPLNHERIFKAYFSSCCGGKGQSAAEAFGDPVIPPLSAQANGSICSTAPRYTWPTVVISKADLTQRFHHFGQTHNTALKDLAMVSRIDILSVNSVGRPVLFTITDARGRRFAINGEDLRRAINTDSTPKTKVFSSLFQLDNQPAEIRFVNGHGLGHGVGMCQWCAERRAEQGMGFESIVLLSFPQSKILKAY